MRREQHKTIVTSQLLGSLKFENYSRVFSQQREHKNPIMPYKEHAFMIHVSDQRGHGVAEKISADWLKFARIERAKREQFYMYFRESKRVFEKFTTNGVV